MGEYMHNARRLIALTPLLLLLASTAAPGADQDFLLPDQAFRISASARGAESVVVVWDIADGYYLYKNKFRFVSQTPEIETGSPKLPPAETKHDRFFGNVPIYRKAVSIPLPLTRDPQAGDKLTLEATYQGCADAGLCYPPQHHKLLLTLPKLATGQTPKAAEASAGPENQLLLQQPPTADGLTGLNQSLGLSTADSTLLQPDQAFRFSAEVASPDRLQLNWVIADGTYLYRDKIKLTLADARGVSLGPFALPPGELKTGMQRPDGTIGAVEVYHHGIDLMVPLVRTDATTQRVTLVARYQGCADRGVCYPPIVKRVSLQLPAAGTDSLNPAATETKPQTVATEPTTAPERRGPISEQDRIAALLAGGNLWAIVPIFFGFGLLLALTPCVFPMIPILSGIIAGQGADITTGRAFGLSLAYVLAMALTYTVAGVAAGLFGANIQAAFQNPWILSTFAMVFVALALSMFGFYEIQLPTGLQTRLAEISNRQRGGTLAGVAVMGLLSALIVSPCIAPPLAGALIFIGQTGNAVLGGTALFALSLGMGAPLILIGTSAGKLLPKAGAWMDVVKAVFGVLLLGVAIALIERIVPPPVAMAMWAVLLICSGVYMGALRHLAPEAGGWSKLWKGLGFAVLVYGVAMLVGAAAGGKDTLQPLRGLGIGGGAAAAQEVTFQPIKSVDDLDRAIAAAGGRPVMLDFYAKWCVSCQEMERDTFSDPAVIKALGGFVRLRADVTDNDAQDRALMQGRFGIPGPPAILFFGPNGKELRDYRVIGFESPETFLKHLGRALP
jgi:thiol:disulfide interchange protein DsbD